jgi:hypothetical protein
MVEQPKALGADRDDPPGRSRGCVLQSGSLGRSSFPQGCVRPESQMSRRWAEPRSGDPHINRHRHRSIHCSPARDRVEMRVLCTCIDTGGKLPFFYSLSGTSQEPYRDPSANQLISQRAEVERFLEAGVRPADTHHVEEFEPLAPRLAVTKRIEYPRK